MVKYVLLFLKLKRIINKHCLHWKCSHVYISLDSKLWTPGTSWGDTFVNFHEICLPLLGMYLLEATRIFGTFCFPATISMIYQCDGLWSYVIMKVLSDKVVHRP